MTDRQDHIAEVASIMADLQHSGSCTSRRGHNRTSVYKIRPILSQAMRKKGWEYSTKMTGGTLVVRRWD